MASVRIPTRFEAVLETADIDFAPLLLAHDPDLAKIDYLRRLSEVQNSGVLSFILGEPGAGKTTAVYAASVFLADRFEPVYSVPHNVPLREIPSFLETNLPLRTDRSRLCLLDGREVSDDTVGVRQLMSHLNQLLRRRPDLIVCWPTSDEEWHRELRSLAERVGADAIAPTEADVAIDGPPKDSWREVLDRILIHMDFSPDELALTDAVLRAEVDGSDTLGGFLGRVARQIARQIDEVQLSQALPEVVFVITSVSAVAGEANRLRRAGSYLLKPSELLAYSPRSRAAKWWNERGEDPKHQLGYMVALFRATLTTMTPSAVNYACAEFADEGLRLKVKDAGIARSASNGDRTFKNTDFYRFLSGTTTTELTSTQKGKPAASTLAAYAAVQGESRTRHKTINQSICSLADRNVDTFRADTAEYEVHFGDQDLVTDAIVRLNERALNLEFHHLSGERCRASNMAQYIMEKLQHYSVAYNLVPR